MLEDKKGADEGRSARDLPYIRGCVAQSSPSLVSAPFITARRPTRAITAIPISSQVISSLLPLDSWPL